MNIKTNEKKKIYNKKKKNEMELYIIKNVTFKLSDIAIIILAEMKYIGDLRKAST